jgi:glyoxylase-like metal-dependent hydrolase (beta-lactamase superfamily II)
MKLKQLSCARAVAAALAVTSSLAVAQTQPDIHRDAATRNTGGDAFMMQYARAFYCNLPDDNNQIVIAARAWNNTTGTGTNAQYRIPLTQIFDDVWFIGNHYVGQYLIKTPDGLVQVDAGNVASEMSLFNYPAMQALGLSASYPLKNIFLTHGHGDHDGGAQWLLDNLGARSVLGSADAAGKSYAPTTIDSNSLAMRQMSIGGKSFWILPTPGHTNGATSAVLEVKDWGTTRRVLINGGQSMTNSIPAVAQYLDSIERTYAMVNALKVDGVMTPHIYWDGEGEKIREILATGRTNPSQHVYGHESVVRQMVVARECSAAWLSRLDTTVVLPVWRYNKLQFVGQPSATQAVVRLSNGWDAVANRRVRFALPDTREACIAITDSNGIAACTADANRPFRDEVTAFFDGAESPGFVDLPHQATASVCTGGRCKAAR